MNRWGVLFRRELARWWFVPTHYLLPAGLLLLCGWVFTDAVSVGGSRGGAAALALFGSLPFWLSVIVSGAVLGTSLMEEEHDPAGSSDLLWSAPVTAGDVVIARFLAAWLWLVCAYLPSVLLFAVLMALSPAAVVIGTLVSGYLSLVLALGVFVAGGLMASVLLRHRGPSAVLVALVALALLFATGSQSGVGVWAVPLRAFRLPESHHLSRFAAGTVEGRYVAGYLVAMVWMLWAAIILVESRWRRRPCYSPLIGSFALSALLAAMVVFVAARHPMVVRLTDARHQVVGARTLELARRLDHQITVTIVCRTGDRALPLLRKALLECRSVASLVAFDTVDPDRDLAAMRNLSRRCGGSLATPALVVSDATGIVAVNLGSALSDSNGNPDNAENDADVVDGALAGALSRVLHPQSVTVGFVTGHGEHDPDDDRMGRGLSAVARRLREEHVTVRRVQLAASEPPLNTFQALVIAGPERQLARPELDALAAYLRYGGRALLLLDADSAIGIEDLLANWGVRLSGQLVAEHSSGTALVDRRTEAGGTRSLVAARYGDHAVTRRLTGLVTVFPRPQCVEALDGDLHAGGDKRDRLDRPAVTPLILSSSASWAESNADAQPPSFDAAEDRAGPLPLAVAVERGAAGELDMHLRSTRLVVVGDSGFAVNGGLAGANADFFLNSMNWLLDRDRLLDAPPRPSQHDETRLAVPAERMLWIMALGVIPALPLCAAGLVAWTRRDRRRRHGSGSAVAKAGVAE
ncbi:MAG: Gldg family protein [bacterium]